MKEQERFQKLEKEVSFKFSKSSKAKGSSLEARQVKVTLKWKVLDSKLFDEDEKKKIINYFQTHAADKIDKEGEIIIYSKRTGSQELNRQYALEKLKRLIKEALKPSKTRQPIQVSPEWHEARIKEKKIISEKKRLRKKISQEDLEREL